MPRGPGSGGLRRVGRGRGGKGGRDGTGTRPHRPPSPGGVAPRRPSHSRDHQAGPGRAGLGPRTRPGPPAPSPVPPAPAAPGGEGVGAGPARPSNLLQVHCHDSRPSGSRLPGREGPCPPRPLPPGYIRSPRSRPRPGPAVRGRSGSRAPRAAPPWPCAEPPGWTHSGAGGGAAHTLRVPSAARAPIHPPVSRTRGGGGGDRVRRPGPSEHPAPPAPLT